MYNYNWGCFDVQGGNVGVGNCNQDLKNVNSFLLLPKGTMIKRSEIPTMVSLVKTMLSNDNWAQRAQFVTGIKGAELANVDATTGNYGYGGLVTTQDAKVGRTYTFAGKCQSIALSKINKMASSFDVVFVHDGGVLNFAPASIDGEDAIKGFSIDTLEVGLYQETIQDALPMFTVNLILANSDEWRNSVVVMPMNGNPMSEWKSLRSIGLSYIKATPVVAGTYAISLEDCSAEDIISVYDTEVIDVDNWVVEDADNGAVMAIDTLAIANGRLLFKILTTDPNFMASTRIRIKGAAVSTLVTNGITGFQFGSVEFNKA